MMLYPYTRSGNGNQAKHHNRCAADDRGGNGVDQRAEFWREAEQESNHRRCDKHQRRVNLGDGHHADVLRVSGHTAAADRAGKQGGQPVADERAAHVRVHIASGHPCNCLQMA
ncbi:hypothetical protein D3C78_701020 [compost metagenome]